MARVEPVINLAAILASGTPIALETKGTVREARGRGWGRAVVAALANELLGSGVQPLYVTAENNQRSIRVAEAVGFTDTGTSIYSGSVTLQATN